MADENKPVKEEKPAAAPATPQPAEDAQLAPGYVEEKLPPVYDRLGDVKVFNKWTFKDVVVKDAGLRSYVSLRPISIPHSGAKHANKSFGKRRMNIIERLVNNMMRTEVYTGKKTKAYSAVKRAFEIIEQKTKQNPIQVYCDALGHAAPREEITRLKYGGISVPKAVDISPARRLDTAVRNICKGAVQSSFKSKKSIEQCLANEIMNAANADMNSFAVSKKEELERVSMSAR